MSDVNEHPEHHKIEGTQCVWTHAFYKTCVQTAYDTNCGQVGARADTDEDLDRWQYCPYCGRRLVLKEAKRRVG